jgi:peroxiredoxin
MQQVVDLQNDPEFQSLGVQVLSIAFDSTEEMAPEAQALGITDVPMLSDGDHSVSEAYDVLQWAVKTGEPGHTFVLIGADGRIAWQQDYGAPENRGVMYVPIDELTQEVRAALD